MALIAGLVVFSTAMAGNTKKLYLFDWADYMAPAIVKAFEKKYGVDVVINNYNSNGELFAKLRTGGSSEYDVVVPSGYFIPRLINGGLIHRLDHSKLPNIKNLKKRFRNPRYDPHNAYSVPYQWGTTSLAYNSKTLGDIPKSWSVIFDPAVTNGHPFSMQPSAEVMLGAACAYLGYPYNCTKRSQLEQAAQLLIKTKRRANFSGFVEGTPTVQQLVRGAVTAGVIYNGDFLLYGHKNPEAFTHLKYMIPKEGAQLVVDTMAIPKKTPHLELAYKFINFVLSAKMGAALSNYTYFATPNAAAVPFLKEILKRPPSTPTAKQMKRLSFSPVLSGDQLKLVQQLWGEVLSR